MRPFIQNFKWHCPDHWKNQGILQPLYGKVCNCGFQRPAWAIDREQAIPLALKAIRDGNWEMRDSCTMCGDRRAEGYVMCTGCDRQTYFDHEFDFLKYLIDGEWQGEQPFVDECRK